MRRQELFATRHYATPMPPHDNCYNRQPTAPARSNPATNPSNASMMLQRQYHTGEPTRTSEVSMQRITITIEDDLLAEIDAAAHERGYQNRSEIIRDLARAGLQQSAENAAPSGQCVAALVYVYDHAARDLSKRLVQNFHGHHDLSLATLHVHL